MMLDRPSVTAVVVSTQHDPSVTHEQIQDDIKKHVIHPVIPSALLPDRANVNLH